MKEMKIKAHAKINLSLDVLAKREDGYHDVDMVMQLIGLHDLLSFRWEEEADHGIGQALCPAGNVSMYLDVRGSDLPADESNLVFKAAKAFCDHLAAAGKAIPAGVLTVEVEKCVPTAAGMAGGSADAAAVLLALDQLWDTRLGVETLCDISKTFGSDIAFAVRGMAAQIPAYEEDAYTCARATGTGTDLEPLPAMAGPLVVVMPPVQVSTGKAYGALDDPAVSARVAKRPDTEGVVTALAEKDPAKLYASMANVFEAYTLVAHEEVAEEKALMEKALAAAGAEGTVQMSGTGPSLFLLTEDEEAASKAAAELTALGLTVFETKRLG